MVGNQEQISCAQLALEQAEDQLCYAQLRLRILQGGSLLRTGDSYPTRSTQLALDKLGREFDMSKVPLF